MVATDWLRVLRHGGLTVDWLWQVLYVVRLILGRFGCRCQWWKCHVVCSSKSFTCPLCCPENKNMQVSEYQCLKNFENHLLLLPVRVC